MKSRFNTIIDLQGKPWLVNPAQVAAITLTGGIVETKSNTSSRFFAHEDVVVIALAGGEKIHCAGFGKGHSALESCAWQIENGSGEQKNEPDFSEAEEILGRLSPKDVDNLTVLEIRQIAADEMIPDNHRQLLVDFAAHMEKGGRP